MEKRIPTGFHLKEELREKLTKIAKKFKINNSRVVELLIEETSFEKVFEILKNKDS